MANDSYLHLAFSLGTCYIATNISSWGSGFKQLDFVEGAVSKEKVLVESAISLDPILKDVQTEAFNRALKKAYAIVDNRILDFWKIGWRQFVLEDERYLFSNWAFEEVED